MKKVVLKLDLHDEKDKKKALRAVSGLEGLDSISMDMKDKKLTVIGDVDPVSLVSKLRKKLYRPEILSVGPAKEEKKEEPKKEQPKKPDEKKKDPLEEYLERMKASYNYAPRPDYYFVRSQEEDPTACVIC